MIFKIIKYQEEWHNATNSLEFLNTLYSLPSDHPAAEQQQAVALRQILLD
jgi:hypothetical protein